MIKDTKGLKVLHSVFEYESIRNIYKGNKNYKKMIVDNTSEVELYTNILVFIVKGNAFSAELDSTRIKINWDIMENIKIDEDEYLLLKIDFMKSECLILSIRLTENFQTTKLILILIWVALVKRLMY